MKDCLEKLAIYDAVWILSKDETFYQVFFPCEGPGMECDFVLQTIKDRGIGERGLSTIGYVTIGSQLIKFSSLFSVCDWSLTTKERV